MNKKVFIIAALLFLPLIASAHDLRFDGSVGALMHIEPDDTPVAGKQASLSFDIEDKAGKMQLQNCDCQFIIASGRQTIFRKSITDSSPKQTFDFTFPRIGAYEIFLQGSPKNPGQFPKFDIHYDVQVQAVPIAGWRVLLTSHFWLHHAAHIVLFGLAFFANAYVFWRNRKLKAVGITNP